MKKLKYIIATVVCATVFVSCETEEIDKKLQEDPTTVTPILRFEYNDQQTVVTDKVTYENTGDTSFNIVAKFNVINPADSNPTTRYKPATLKIGFSHRVLAHFPTKLSLENPTSFLSSVTLNVTGEGSYATINAKDNQETGSATISVINEGGQYMDGDFQYILYPQPNLGLTPKKLSSGKFNYVKY